MAPYVSYSLKLLKRGYMWDIHYIGAYIGRFRVLGLSSSKGGYIETYIRGAV